MKKVWFDMDGTIADLYGQNDWLECIHNESTKAFEQAKPLINMQALARVLNNMQKQGFEIGIVSWTPKGTSQEYNEQVRRAKVEWLNKHLASVKFNSIDIIDYGKPKQENRQGVLFDDEQANRDNWQGVAHNVDNIINILKEIKKVA